MTTTATSTIDDLVAAAAAATPSERKALGAAFAEWRRGLSRRGFFDAAACASSLTAMVTAVTNHTDPKPHADWAAARIAALPRQQRWRFGLAQHDVSVAAAEHGQPGHAQVCHLVMVLVAEADAAEEAALRSLHADIVAELIPDDVDDDE